MKSSMSVHSMNLPRIKRRNTVLRPSTVFKPVDHHPTTKIDDDLDSTHRMHVLKTKDFLSAGNILKRYGAKHKVRNTTYILNNASVINSRF